MRSSRAQGFTDDMLAVVYPSDESKSVLLDRLDWARSYCKLGGVLESPKRGLFLVTDLGNEIAALPGDEAGATLRDIDREVRRRRRRTTSAADAAPTESEEVGNQPAPADLGDEEDQWRRELLERLHQLSPGAFERFTLFLLRSFGMELRRQGGPGDEGIDGIGTAPLTDVLTTTVAVQAKRYEPGKVLGREVVALFQTDASAAGAEHGVLVTTARFSEAARKAALGRTPTIDLIVGDRLADLCLRQQVGVSTRPVVESHWFRRFEDESPA
jgi:restriction system protein